MPRLHVPVRDAQPFCSNLLLSSLTAGQLAQPLVKFIESSIAYPLCALGKIGVDDENFRDLGHRFGVRRYGLPVG